MISRHLISAAVVGATVVLALAWAAKSRPRRRNGGRSLKPTLFTHGITVLYWAISTLVIYAAFTDTREDQLLAIYSLVVGFGAGAIYLTWYNYTRVVYWTVEGVGLCSLLGKPSFIYWQNATWAGKKWSSFQITDGTTKIHYSHHDGGHTALNRLIKRKLPRFVSNFT